MKYETVIWDFNGTILSDVSVGIAATNALLERRGMKTIPSAEYYRSILRFPISDYYVDLGFDFSKTPYETLSAEYIEEYNRLRHTARLTNGVFEALEALRRLNVRQLVLSATETGLLNKQLSELGVASYFCETLALDNFYASGKLDIAKKWFSGKNLHAVFIGDTPHDWECAEAVGADCVLYCGGHASKESLLSCGCPVCDSMDEVLRIIISG